MKGGISSIRLPNRENMAKCNENARKIRPQAVLQRAFLDHFWTISGPGPAECARPSKGLLTAFYCCICLNLHYLSTPFTQPSPQGAGRTEGPLGRAHRRPSIYALHTVSDRRREACNQKPAIARGRNRDGLHCKE